MLGPADIPLMQAPSGPSEGARSTVKFPYVGLDSALSLTTELYRNYGTECSLEELAACLGSRPTSGAFRIRVAAARMFGLIQQRPKVAALTDLGRAVVDPERRQSAIVEAFLSVPLYAQLHELFEGDVLPPSAGLEKVIRDLGVTAKSATRARQAFSRSASIAGFFPLGDSRLINPLKTYPSLPIQDDQRRDESEGTAVAPEAATRQPVGGGPSNPVLRALWETLPTDEFDNPEERAQWLKAFRVVFEMAYGPDDSKPASPSV